MQEVGGKILWGKRNKCLGKYFSTVKIVIRIAVVVTESAVKYSFFEKARELGVRVNTIQIGPFSLVCMLITHGNNSYLRTFQ